MSEPLGKDARGLIAAIASGQRFRRRARAGGAVWTSGAVSVPAALVAELQRRDLIAVEDGVPALTDAGAGWAFRQSAGPRLLAERALPDDDGARPAAPAPGRPSRTRSVTVNLAESPLGWLKSRGLVNARQYQAGERLRGDWTIAGMAPRVTMRWDAGARSTGDGLDPTLAQIAAKRRMEAALDAAGPGLKDVLWRIVCAGEGMETAERALGWPARAGRVVLTLALDRLADFYGLG